MGHSVGMAQNDIHIDSYYFINTQGLDVYLNGRFSGSTPMMLTLPDRQKSTVEFRNRSGNDVMVLRIQPERVNNARNVTSQPNWYNREQLATGYSGFTLSSASADSRSLSISINKAKNEAFGKLANMKRGNRLTSSRPNSASNTMPDAQILECYIYFDDNSYKTFLLAGVPN
jgi:hypothetical protein